MGWNTVMKPEKGLLAGVPFVGGDITGNITFSNYSADVNTTPTVSQDQENHRIQEYIGWTPDNSFNWTVSNLDTTHKLVAAFRLTTIDIMHPGAGTFLCLKMWARNIQNTESRKSAYIGCEWTKRVYTDNIAYTETYPLGTYWTDNEYNFTPSTEFPNRSAETIAIFLKTGYFDLVENVVGGMAIGWRNGYASCYSNPNAFRAKYSWFKSANGFGIDADFPEGDQESPEFGPQSMPEGYEPAGGFDDSSDPIGMPALPQSVLSLGFVNVYKCDAGSLTMLGGELFPNISFPTSLTDIGPVLAAIGDSIWNSKLIDYVISVHCIPGKVTGGDLEDIKVGTRTMTGILARPITNEYVDYNFGTVTLPKYYKNYADYFTEIQLYLPFYGFVSIRPEEIIDGEINVKYRFNVIDGSFIACIFATSSRSKLTASLIGQYGGSCIVHLPVSNLSYASMFSSLIGAGATGAMAAMGVGGATVTAAAIGLTASQGIVNAAQGGDVKKSNSYNASSSFMTRAKPYLIVTRPVSSFSTRYNIENGLPSNVSMTIGSCNGFTQVDAPIINFACTDEEQREIIAALKEGVIV